MEHAQRDGKDKDESHHSMAVLILILMEHAQRVSLLLYYSPLPLVLILILLEHAQRDPRVCSHTCVCRRVLILILLEHAQREHEEIFIR